MRCTKKSCGAIHYYNCHDALQFRGFLSHRCIDWAQRECIWEDDHQHARFRLDYASVRLLFLVMEESSVMWATLPKKERLARHGGIRIEDPLSGTWLVEYVEWCGMPRQSPI